MQKFLNPRDYCSFSAVIGEPGFETRESKRKTPIDNGTTENTKLFQTLLKGTNVFHGPFVCVTVSKRQNGDKCWRMDIAGYYFLGNPVGNLERILWFFIVNSTPVLFKRTLLTAEKKEKISKTLATDETLKSFKQRKTEIEEQHRKGQFRCENVFFKKDEVC